MGIPIKSIILLRKYHCRGIEIPTNAFGRLCLAATDINLSRTGIVSHIFMGILDVKLQNKGNEAKDVLYASAVSSHAKRDYIY